MAIDRTNFNALIDSNGTPGHGSAWDKQAIEDVLLDPIDAAIAAGGLSSGSNYINDTANANMTVGLTINQGTADDEALSLKSSDVAHGVTAVAETDTYGTLAKLSGTLGGLAIEGFSDDGSAGVTALRGTSATAADQSRSTSGRGIIRIDAYLISGTGRTAIAGNSNILTVETNQTTRFVLDSDGDSHQDVGTAWTNFDTHDDVSVLNLLTAYVTRPEDPLRATFGHWLLQSRETLERLRLVQFNDDGHHFVNMSRLTMLLVGAVRQLGSRVDRMEQRLRALEA